MKITRNWVNGGLPTLYYYADQTGRIVGETSITGTGNSCKYSCVVYSETTESKSLGMYISSEDAKRAIEHFWHNQDWIYEMAQDQLENVK